MLDVEEPTERVEAPPEQLVKPRPSSLAKPAPTKPKYELEESRLEKIINAIFAIHCFSAVINRLNRTVRFSLIQYDPMIQ